METMQIETPVGYALVQRLANGFHVRLPGEGGLEHYYSDHGKVFWRAFYVDAPNLLLGPKEMNREKIAVLRGIWTKFIDAESARRNPF